MKTLRQNMKKFIIALIAMSLLISNTLILSAAPISAENELLASYNMDIGGTQVFKKDINGESTFVKITEITPTTRVANGTYLVEHTRTGSWTAGFYINISGNTIKSAYGAYCHTIIGSKISEYLSLDSPSQATYSFVHKIQSVYTTTGFRSVISGNSINVYGL